jgi:hypothetical protein
MGERGALFLPSVAATAGFRPSGRSGPRRRLLLGDCRGSDFARSAPAGLARHVAGFARGVTAFGEWSEWPRLKLRMAGPSRSGGMATGSLKRGQRGKRVRGFPLLIGRPTGGRLARRSLGEDGSLAAEGVEPPRTFSTRDRRSSRGARGNVATAGAACRVVLRGRSRQAKGTERFLFRAGAAPESRNVGERVFERIPLRITCAVMRRCGGPA